MLAETRPLVMQALLEKKGRLLLLILLSVVAGFLPTMKSQVEATFINGVAGQIGSGTPPEAERSDGPEARRSGGPFDAFSERVMGKEEADRTRKDLKNSDLSAKLSFLVLERASLFQALLWYVFLAAMAYVAALSAKTVTTRIRQSVFKALCAEGYRRGIVFPPQEGKSEKNPAGHYAQAIQQGASSVADSYEYILEVCQIAFSLVIVFSLIVTKSPPFTLICFSLVLGQCAVSFLQARQLQGRRNLFDKSRNRLLAVSDDILDKREIILAHEQTERYSRKLGKLANKYATINRKLSISEECFGGIGQTISDIGQALILGAILFAAYWIRPGTISSVGGVIFFVTIYRRMLSPTRQLLFRYDSFMRSKDLSKVFLELIRTEHLPTGSDEPTLESPILEKGDLAISFSEVSFSFVTDDESRQVLQSCSFQAPKNGTTMILGRSGSGKTTIARILLGFLKVDSGSVHIFGHDMKKLSQSQALKWMSYVSQEAFIVDDTVRDNLLWGSEAGQIRESDLLATLQSLRVIQAMEESQILRKRARQLSTGQKQRLCLARILLDRAPIVILDEPLSGIDVFTLQEVLPVLTQHLKDRRRTVIIFSHRIALLELADHAVVLDDKGGVAEEGAPSDLLTRRESILASLVAASRGERSQQEKEGD